MHDSVYSGQKPASPSSAIINIQNLRLRTLIGFNPDERVKKQDVVLNIEIKYAIDSAVLQDHIEEALDYKVINSGLSGETTASGKNRLDWVLNQQIDIFVLELGANDGLRGISLNETKKNLQLIIDRVREHNPQVIIVLSGMQIPPYLGIEYTKGFKNIFPELADKNKISLIPFLLENVAGNVDLNQPDGIHPTKEGHIVVAQNVWEVLKNSL